MATQVIAPNNNLSRYDQAEVIATIKQTVAKGATDAQLRMFLEVCKRTGLDPFLKEVWYVPEKGIIMAGRDGYLRIANENPQFDGMETRVERDKTNVPIKAICSVWRKDRKHAITCEAYFSEYAKSSPVWKQYPSAMISKVAEVLALKRSFSINGVVSEEEIGADANKLSAEKIHEVRRPVSPEPPITEPQPVVGLINELPEYEYEEIPEPESKLEQELADSIRMVNQRKNPASATVSGRPAWRIDMLRSFALMANRYRAIRMEHTYAAILALHGVHDMVEFPETPEGRDQALKCHRDMIADITRREQERRHA